MMIIKIALWLEKNEWCPKSIVPALAICICFGLAYFTALFFGQLKSYSYLSHLFVIGLMLVAGIPLLIICKAIRYLDRRDGS